MDVIGHLLSALISLVFLAILGTISGVAIPGLFLAVVAPWLDWIAPVRERRD
ncbi:MAG: hypothetical protein HYU51_00125 [Candidatus Rokubacteria bacterium]|nr:hypothetical protein [Candidatus Rokubacteria bacterium]